MNILLNKHFDCHYKCVEHWHGQITIRKTWLYTIISNVFENATHPAHQSPIMTISKISRLILASTEPWEPSSVNIRYFLQKVNNFL
jgi:hypothetical protein